MSDPLDNLRKMVDCTVNGDTEGAEQAFKDYIIPKTMEVMGLNKSPELEPKAEAPQKSPSKTSKS